MSVVLVEGRPVHRDGLLGSHVRGRPVTHSWQLLRKHIVGDTSTHLETLRRGVQVANLWLLLALSIAWLTVLLESRVGSVTVIVLILASLTNATCTTKTGKISTPWFLARIAIVMGIVLVLVFCLLNLGHRWVYLIVLTFIIRRQVSKPLLLPLHFNFHNSSLTSLLNIFAVWFLFVFAILGLVTALESSKSLLLCLHSLQVFKDDSGSDQLG